MAQVKQRKDWRMSCDVGKATEGLEKPMSQLILQPLRCFTYVTAHSPNLPLLHLRHSSFSNPSFASPTSHALHLCRLASRSFTANSGTKAAVLPKGRYSTANSGTQAAVLLGMNRCGSFPLLSAPTLSLASEQTLKYLKRSQGHQRGGEESGFGQLGPQKFTTGVKYQLHQDF